MVLPIIHIYTCTYIIKVILLDNQPQTPSNTVISEKSGVNKLGTGAGF